MIHCQEKKQLIKSNPKIVQMLDLVDKDFYMVIENMSKILKKM